MIHWSLAQLRKARGMDPDDYHIKLSKITAGDTTEKAQNRKSRKRRKRK